MLCERAVRNKFNCFASGRDFTSILGASARSQTFQSALFGVLWGLSRRSRDAPGMILWHIENATDGPWELLGRHGMPGRLPEAILDESYVPRGPPWKRLCAISALIFMPIFATIVSLLSTILGDSHDFETKDETRDKA